MDQQLIQQMMQLCQQMLQTLQAAGGAQDMGVDDGDMEYGGEDDFEQENAAPPMGGDDGAMPGDDPMAGMPARKTLNDRVKMLENHTGLMRKSADASLATRIDDLEDSILGEQYEGTAVQRIEQLEAAVGLELSKSADVEEDDAPDVIPLDALIKSAIDEGIQKGLAAIQKQAQAESEGLPSPGEMRKAAKSNGGVKYGSRKAQQTTVSTDADLVKAAQQYGYSEEELDQPVGLADLLQLEYVASKAGQSYFGDDDD